MTTFNTKGIRDAAKKIAQPVELMPRLAGESVAPDIAMYGKILVYSAQMVEPMATQARQTLFNGMATAGQSIVDGLNQTADDYDLAERANAEAMAALEQQIEEMWG